MRSGIDVDTLRAATPGCAHRVHLNNAGAALMSQRTLDPMTEHLRLEAEIGGYEAADAARDGIQDTYPAIAELVGGRAGEVALFDNATHAWNAAFYSVALGPGDRVLTGRAEYGSNVLAYLQVGRRTGAEVVVVPNDATGQLDTAALNDPIDERTKLVGVSHVPTSGGLVNPAAEIGRVARAAGALYLLDATQSVGQFPVDVEAIGCDLLTGTGRKFLRGPRGTGFLWARDEALERLDPFVAEVRSATWDGGRGFTWAAGARRFETWEYSYVNVLGLRRGRAPGARARARGIGERSLRLGAALRERLDDVHGVAPTTSARALRDRHRVGRRAWPLTRSPRIWPARGMNVSTTVPEQTPFDTEERGVHPLVRLSPHVYNTEDELDRAVRAIVELRS